MEEEKKAVQKKKRSASLKFKLYLYLGITVFMASLVVALVSYLINSNQIDEYYEGLSFSGARHFAAYVDGDYLRELRKTASTDEFQKLREKAEAEEDESLIEDYLREKDLWDQYVEIRDDIDQHLRTMDNVKYLYVVACGGANDIYDMYLIDDYDNPIYETGYYEEREEELRGKDMTKLVMPTISHGDWGWLCSSFVPIMDSNGDVVAQVGCDVDMNDIIKERRMALLNLILAAVVITGIILLGAVALIRSSVVKPLNMITKEMKKFSPSDDYDYEKSGVMNLNINSHDEIEDIYNEIKSMQIRILDDLESINTIQKEKEKAESDIKEKAKEIDVISKEAYSDSLTKVGSKTAYINKTNELNEKINKHDAEFAIVMIDANYLKVINDKYGHAAGDEYLKGCCKILCRVYKHSPVYRIGGDEFVAILMGDDYKERNQKLEEMREAFKDSFNQTDLDPWFRFSASVGMGEYIDGDSDAEVVFKRADKSMYDEKSTFKKKNKIDALGR